MRHPKRLPALLTAGAPWVLALLLVALARLGLAVTPPAGGGSGIEFSAITLSYNPDGSGPVDGPILRGKTFYVRVKARDNDPVGDPPPNYDVITQVRLYCRKKTGGAWPDWMRGQRNFDEPWHKAEFKVGEDLDLDGPDANGWYTAVIAQTINAAGLYQFAVEADDAGNPTNDDTGKAGDKDATVLGVDYVIVVPNPAYVVVSGQVGLTGKAYSFGLKANGDPDDERHFDNSGNVIDGTADNDVQFDGPFDWTEDSELGSVNPPQGDATTFTAGADPEAVTVTATHHETNVAGSATVEVGRISQADDLWWFDGENPGGGYHIQTTLTANGVTEGTFKWEVTDGADKVDLNNGGADADVIEAEDDNTVVIKSTAPSAGAAHVTNDVTVTLKIDGQLVQSYQTVVLAPDHLVWLRDVDAADATWGYDTQIHYRIENQFNDVLPHDVPLNEDFTAPPTPDFPGMDWRRGNEGSATVGPADWLDQIQGETSTHTPAPVGPNDPGAGTAVYHWPGTWNIGSATIGGGLTVGCSRWNGSPTCVWQKYRGYADHE